MIPFQLEKEEELGAVERALEEALEGRAVVAAEPVAGRLAVVVVVLKRDLEAARSALSRLGIGELRLSGPYAGLSLGQAKAKMAERARLAPEELAGVEDGLRRLADPQRQQSRHRRLIAHTDAGRPSVPCARQTIIWTTARPHIIGSA